MVAEYANYFAMLTPVLAIRRDDPPLLSAYRESGVHYDTHLVRGEASSEASRNDGPLWLAVAVSLTAFGSSGEIIDPKTARGRQSLMTFVTASTAASQMSTKYDDDSTDRLTR